VALKSCIYFDY